MLVAKRLKMSDLTLFRDHQGAGRQRAWNLDAHPFTSTLYPGLPAGTYDVASAVTGPGGAETIGLLGMSVARQQKNWRYQGPMIPQAARFEHLAPGDVVLLDFAGIDAPNRVDALLVAAGASRDASLHGNLSAHLGDAGMRALSGDDWETLLLASDPDAGHPAWELGLDPEEPVVEAEGPSFHAASSPATGIRRRRAGRRRAQSPLELELAAILQREIGEAGEEIVHAEHVRAHGADRVRWISREDATHPHDIDVEFPGEVGIADEVKSTRGGFSRPFHISKAELREASTHTGYRITRVYDLSRGGANVRFAAVGVTEWAADVLKRIAVLESAGGIAVPQLRAFPDEMPVSWSPSVSLERP